MAYFQNTVPSINLRAVLKIVAFFNIPSLSNSAPTIIFPLLCPNIMPSSFTLLSLRQSLTTLPLIFAAAATAIANVTGSARCGCPTLIARTTRSAFEESNISPDRILCDVGADTMAIFGIEPVAVSSVAERPISTEAWRRIFSKVERRVGWASVWSGRMVPETLRDEAERKTHGFPASMQVTDMPSMVSVILPVGRSLPVLEPLGTVRVHDFVLFLQEVRPTQG